MDDRPQWERDIDGTPDANGDVTAPDAEGLQLVSAEQWREQLDLVTARCRERRRHDGTGDVGIEYSAWLVREHNAWLDAAPARAAQAVVARDKVPQPAVAA